MLLFSAMVGIVALLSNSSSSTDLIANSPASAPKTATPLKPTPSLGKITHAAAQTGSQLKHILSAQAAAHAHEQKGHEVSKKLKFHLSEAIKAAQGDQIHKGETTKSSHHTSSILRRHKAHKRLKLAHVHLYHFADRAAGKFSHGGADSKWLQHYDSDSTHTSIHGSRLSSSSRMHFSSSRKYNPYPHGSRSVALSRSITPCSNVWDPVSTNPIVKPKSSWGMNFHLHAHTLAATNPYRHTGRVKAFGNYHLGGHGGLSDTLGGGNNPYPSDNEFGNGFADD